MIRYRPHRGTLEDSMAEAQHFNYVTDMMWYIERESQGAVKVENISISKSYGKDERIDWKSWRYVCTSQYGAEKYDTPQCIGMCDLGELG